MLLSFKPVQEQPQRLIEMKALILRSGVEPKSLHLKPVFLLSVLALHLEKYTPNFLPLSVSAPFLSPTQSHSLKVFVLFFAIVI